MNCIQESNWLSPKECDVVEKEFVRLVSKKGVRDRCKEFRRAEQRLDQFWMTVLSQNNASPVLTKFFKVVLLLSHGNAFVERGFSTNKEIEVENQKHPSLVAQRQVFDGVMAEADGDVGKVDITRAMISKVNHSRQEYMQALEDEKRAKTESSEEKLKKRRICDQLQELKEKRRRLNLEHQNKSSEIEAEIVLEVRFVYP